MAENKTSNVLYAISHFGEMGFGELGFGDLGFGELGFGDLGFGELGFGEVGGHPGRSSSRSLKFGLY